MGDDDFYDEGLFLTTLQTRVDDKYNKYVFAESFTIAIIAALLFTALLILIKTRPFNLLNYVTMILFFFIVIYVIDRTMFLRKKT